MTVKRALNAPRMKKLSFSMFVVVSFGHEYNCHDGAYDDGEYFDYGDASTSSWSSSAKKKKDKKKKNIALVLLRRTFT